MKRTPIDPELLRDRLAAEQGKQYWRSLDELAGDPAVTAMLQREFPDGAANFTDAVSRRRFLMLMGASIALAGATGCRPPTGTIRARTRGLENQIPGKSLFYATSMTIAGYATGLLVESNDGRPTKIEGNPQHPASQGGTSAIHQASVLGLYDPDRSQSVSFRQQSRPWNDLVELLRRRLADSKGAGVAILTDTVSSPTLAAQIDAFLKDYPQARWYHHEPANSDNALIGSELAFGKIVHSYAKLDDADVIVSLGANFLGEGPAQLVHSRAFAKRRRQNGNEVGGKRGMNRLYAIETDLTITGANADHRLALKPSAIETFARALASKLGLPVEAEKLDDTQAKFVEAVANDLKARPKGSTVVLVGDSQPAAVHAIGHAINALLGNAGTTVVYTDPVLPNVTPAVPKFTQFVDSLAAGDIDTLFVIASNPAYSAPVDLDVARLLGDELKKPAAKRKSKKEWLAVHMGLYFDETARLCHWHVPQSHFLETWSDATAYDGTANIVQPLIAPLYDSKSPHDLFAALTRRESDYDNRSGLDLVRDKWKNLSEDAWAKALHDGVIPETAAKPITVTLNANELFSKPAMKPTRASSKGIELAFAVEPGVFDGQFANNGWLQEWPRPLTRLTWDNALMISPATAEKLQIGTKFLSFKSGGEHGEQMADVVLIKSEKLTLEAAIWVVPGHADDAVTLHLGYGRERAGKVGSKLGFNAYKLRKSNASWFVDGVELSKTVRSFSLACVQGHTSMEGRDVVRSGTLEEYKKHPDFATAHDQHPGFVEKDGRKIPLNLYPKEHHYTGYRWGMAIDLSACTGCGSCVVACQAENNSPVIGKEQVARGREMHWLRIDRYFATGNKKEKPTDPLAVHFQPVMCQHCEAAPCELVCPVEATVHGDEGTNDMVYNRCVGTRYCANNCPYKVRRFNFMSYTDYDTPSLKMVYNPEVTVRTRGVIEKCTFCIQRVSYARIEAAKEAMDELDLPLEKRTRRDTNGPDGQPRRHDDKEVPLIRDGEVLSACQTACPADAIVFGDLNDKKSRVHAMHGSTLSYSLLGELGTRPRVAYLAELRNPNPALEAK